MITLSSGASTFVGFLILLVLYFFPTIVAVIRGHQVASVAILNTLLGWSVIGWIIALVMAVRDKPERVIATHPPAPPAAETSTGIYCSDCGAPNMANSSFCSACGKPITRLAGQ